MTASLAEVRESLARRFPDAMPLAHQTAVTVASGIEALDAMLPNGGFARGRLAVWAPGGGATAILRSACANVVRRGERAAWIDGAGTLAEVWPEGSLLVRPGRDELKASRCAEELLRSGGFALVGLSGGGPALARDAVRLARAAKAGGSAFVVVGAEVPISTLRLVSRLPPEGYCWWANPFGEPAEVESVRVEVRAWSLGWSGRTSFSLPVSARRPRLALDPSLPDRRGCEFELGSPINSLWHNGNPRSCSRESAIRKDEVCHSRGVTNHLGFRKERTEVYPPKTRHTSMSYATDVEFTALCAENPTRAWHPG